MAEENLDQIIDMPEQSDMINDARTQARYAVEHFKVESQISNYIKKFLMRNMVLIGIVLLESISIHTLHMKANVICFYEGQMAILLYKMG